jgi:hypothetical protein
MVRTITIGVLCVALSNYLFSQNPGGNVSYSRDIAPVLAIRCSGCHGPDAWWSGGFERGLDVTSYESLMKGGQSGRAIVPSGSSQSLLLLRLDPPQGSDLRQMPFAGTPLSRRTIDQFRRWIDDGAVRDDSSPPKILIRLDIVQVTRDTGGFGLEENILCKLPSTGYVTATVYDRSGKVLFRRGGGVVPEHTISLGAAASVGKWAYWPLSSSRSSHGEVPNIEVDEVSVELTIEHADLESLWGTEFNIERENIVRGQTHVRGSSTFVKNPISLSQDTSGQFTYQLDADADVDIEIVPLNNQRALPVYRDQQRNIRAGTKTYVWTLRDTAGRALPPGAYVARFRCKSRNAALPVNDVCILLKVTA